MNTHWSDPSRPPLRARARTSLTDRDARVDLSRLATGTALGAAAETLAGASVLLRTSGQMPAAIAMVELDGLVRRMTLAPPDLKSEHLAAVIEDAEIDAVVSDLPPDVEAPNVRWVPLAPIADHGERPAAGYDTEWVLLTSGTSGRPKMVAHRLAALTGAIAVTPGSGEEVWATFYDIRRYGGLQIFLRALLGGAKLVLSSDGECVGAHLQRLGREGVTSISGTPSHWRRVLMSLERGAMSPRYIRLSGEIADQFVLDGLKDAYPHAAIGHAYASTEAGVGFAVNDGLEGFPASLVDEPRGELEMKVVDGTLRIRSRRAALRYLGAAAPVLADEEGFIDTGDLVTRDGDRYYFAGRRGGIINVGGLKVNPEEVEAALNSHPAVRMSLVRGRKNPLTGAIVVADIVLKPEAEGDAATRQAILDHCRARLDRHKVPALVSFVANLPLTPGGKLSRAQGAHG